MGAALAVHEGPQRIAHAFGNQTPLKPGMIVSNEPGVYFDGQFGIRLENLMEVTEANLPHNFGGKTFLKFAPLTVLPFQRNLFRPDMLNAKEVDYVNTYHSFVRAAVIPELSRLGHTNAQHWLMEQTEPLV